VYSERGGVPLLGKNGSLGSRDELERGGKRGDNVAVIDISDIVGKLLKRNIRTWHLQELPFSFKSPIRFP
jgi:hypothetical protein